MEASALAGGVGGNGDPAYRPCNSEKIVEHLVPTITSNLEAVKKRGETLHRYIASYSETDRGRRMPQDQIDNVAQMMADLFLTVMVPLERLQYAVQLHCPTGMSFKAQKEVARLLMMVDLFQADCAGYVYNLIHTHVEPRGLLVEMKEHLKAVLDQVSKWQNDFEDMVDKYYDSSGVFWPSP